LPIPHFRKLILAAITIISFTGEQPIFYYFAITIVSRRLKNGLLIRFDAEPSQTFEDCFDIQIRRSLAIRVFDSKQVFATAMSGVQPAKQGCPNATNVKHAGRTWRKSSTNHLHLARPEHVKGAKFYQNSPLYRAFHYSLVANPKSRTCWFNVRALAFPIRQKRIAVPVTIDLEFCSLISSMLNSG
jgi:hypothetical protein